MEQKHKIAIIGHPSTILIFKALGIETVALDHPKQTQERLMELADRMMEGEATPEYAVIFIEETYYKAIAEDVISKLSKRSLPAVVPLPSSNSKDPDFAVHRLSKFVERAVGSDILS